jgi:hypothetical protein
MQIYNFSFNKQITLSLQQDKPIFWIDALKSIKYLLSNYYNNNFHGSNTYN